MQQNGSNVLSLLSYTVVPILLSKLDVNSSHKLAAKKALQTYWESCPTEVQTILRNNGLTHRSNFVKLTILKLLYEVVENTEKFDFIPFLPRIVNLLDNIDKDVSNFSKNILILYFKKINPNNSTEKKSLIHDLFKLNIDSKISIPLLNSINPSLSIEYENLLRKSPFNFDSIKLNPNSQFQDTEEDSHSSTTTTQTNNNSNNNSNNFESNTDTFVTSGVTRVVASNSPIRSSERRNIFSSTANSTLPSKPIATITTDLFPKITPKANTPSPQLPTAILQTSSSISTKTLDRNKTRSMNQLRQQPTNHQHSLSHHKSLLKLDSDITSTKPQDSNQLMRLISNIPCYYPLDNINAIDVSNEYALEDTVSGLLLQFEGKESEHNWSKREKCIIELRGLVRGNAHKLHPTVFANCIKISKEAISKAVLSLRTTLSSNGCQLCKEIGINIGTHLDSQTIEYLLLSLVKLCSARKNISHQNANAGVCGLISNCNITSRMINIILSASQDKNTQPRAYSGTWIHIILLRYQDNFQTLEVLNLVDSIEKALIKGLADPSPTVKEPMRSTFWCLNEISPLNSENIKKKLDNNVLKMLERSKTSNNFTTSGSGAISRPTSRLSTNPSFNGGNSNVNSLNASSSSMSSSKLKHRPSMKELIISRQRERARSETEQNTTSSNTKSSFPPNFLNENRVKSSSSTSSIPSDDTKTENAVYSSDFNMIPSSKLTDQLMPLTNPPNTLQRDRERVSSIGRNSSPTITNISQDHNSENSYENNSSITNNHEIQDIPKESVLPDHDYKQHENKIFQLLSSDDTELEIEGITLLQYSLQLKQQPSIKIKSVLDKLSIMRPQLFYSMLSDDQLTTSLVSCFTADNFIRIICQANSTTKISNRILETICFNMTIDDLCLSLSNIMMYCIDISKIENLNLSITFIRFKYLFIEICIKFITIILSNSNKIIVPDYLLSNLFESLFPCWELMKDDDHYEEKIMYLELLKLCLNKEPSLFERCLNEINESFIRNELCILLDVRNLKEEFKGTKSTTNKDSDTDMADAINNEPKSNSNDYVDEDDLTLKGTLFEMTMINVSKNMKRNELKSSDDPVIGKKNGNEMTMIMPDFKKTIRDSKSQLLMPQLSAITREEDPFRETESAAHKENHDLGLSDKGKEEEDEDHEEKEIEENEDDEKMKLDDVFNDNKDEELQKDNVTIIDDEHKQDSNLFAMEDAKVEEIIYDHINSDINLTELKIDDKLIESADTDSKGIINSNNNSPSRNEIDSILESTDPLNQMRHSANIISHNINNHNNNKNVSGIAIYEDNSDNRHNNSSNKPNGKRNSSPQFIDYDFSKIPTEWHDIEMMRYSSEFDNESVISDDQYLNTINRMKNGEILANTDLISLLTYLNHNEYVNKHELLDTITTYLKSELSIDQIICNLTIIRVLIVFSDNEEDKSKITSDKDYVRLISKLIDLSNIIKEYQEELYYIILELCEILIKKSPNEILTELVNRELTSSSNKINLKDSSSSNPKIFKLSIILDCISNCLNYLNTEQINYEDILTIDNFIFKLINCKETQIRKLIIIIYSQFYHKFKNDNNDDKFDDFIFNKLNSSQFKLIEYYSGLLV